MLRNVEINDVGHLRVGIRVEESLGFSFGPGRCDHNHSCYRRDPREGHHNRGNAE